MPKPDLFDDMMTGRCRVIVKRPGGRHGMWRVQVRRAGRVVRHSWHDSWQSALDDAIETAGSIPAPRPAALTAVTR